MMIWFWLLIATAAAAAVFLVTTRAARAARQAQAPTEDPALSVYRRHLAELDDAAERGLFGEPELEAAKIEASRRLLSAAEDPNHLEQSGGPRSGLWITLAAVACGGLALIVYLFVGRPGVADQPYAARLASWRAVEPTSLVPSQLAEVMKAVSRERPTDPQAFGYLGRAEMASGQAGEASRAFAHALALAPKNLDLQVAYGESLIALADGKVSPDAQRAFQAARALDPLAGAPRYYLARARIENGDVAGGVTDLQALAASLPAGDGHRRLIESQIAEVQRSGGLSVGEGGDPATASLRRDGFIRGMVDRLAKRLETSPDDPQGWARLVRAETVLKDYAARDRALARAQTLFASRPQDLAAIQAAANPTTPPPSAP